MTNKELAALVNDTIKSTGVTKVFIANKLGISRQRLDTILNKTNFTIEDANMILKTIGYAVNVVLEKIEKST